MKDPLKQWKLSPIDLKAQELWEEYSLARDEMFSRTHFAFAPWYVVRADDKRTARINCIKHFLSKVSYPNKNEELLVYDPTIVCEFDASCYEKGLIAP